MLRHSSIVCFLAALALCYAITTKDIVKKVSVCHRNRPDFESCLKDATGSVLDDIGRTGVTDVGVESGNPLVIPELLVQYKNSNLTAAVKITNSKTWVSQDVKITGLRADINDPKRFHVSADFMMPTIVTEGNYKVDARLLVPIRTKGFYNISMTDIVSTTDVTGEHYEKDGVDYVKITDFNMLPEVGDMKIYVSNLFPGNEELSQAAVDFGNRYWRSIYQELLPFTNEQWKSHAIDRLNRVFSVVPFNVMFPEK